MQEPDFWTGDAELLALSIQGQRLIILDIAEAMRALWRRVVRPLDDALPGLAPWALNLRRSLLLRHAGRRPGIHAWRC